MRKDRPSGNLRQECHAGVRHGGDEPDHPEIGAGPSARPELSGRTKNVPAWLAGVQLGESRGGGLLEGLGSGGSAWFQLQETKQPSFLLRRQGGRSFIV